MSRFDREIICLILQCLNEAEYKETMHKLESESGVFFDMRYFEELVTNGEWKEVEKYLLGFTNIEDNQLSTKMFFEVRRAKYIEALHKRDDARALEILRKELRVLSNYHVGRVMDLTMLLNQEDISFPNVKKGRSIMLRDLKKLIDLNPVFRNKLHFPTIASKRLKTLINQGSYRERYIARSFSNDTNSGTIPRVGPDPGPAPSTASLAGSMFRPTSVPHQAVYMRPMGFNPPNNPDYERAMTRALGNAIQESQTHSIESADDGLPKNVVAYLDEGSPVNSMDFHPVRQTLLLVGTHSGEISLWEVGKGERIARRYFKVWDPVPHAFADLRIASVNRIKWNSWGRFFGVAYSKHFVHVYAYYGTNDVRNHLQIDAHIGSVNDLAFIYVEKELSVITCGEDRTIKVWDATTGATHFIFKGHEAPVYSICPNEKDNILFILSTATDGKAKAWTFDKMSSKVDKDAPGHACTTLAYSADGTRLFSCGTSKDGNSYMVEWNESEGGGLKRTYAGLGKCLLGPVHFDTAKNRYLAAGDEFKIKFWDMDNENVLMSTDAGGGLPPSPCIRFSKEGALLAVSTSDDGIKILANAEGLKFMRHAVATSKAPVIGTFGANAEGLKYMRHAVATSKAPVIGTFGASSSAAGPSIVADRRSPIGPIITLNDDSRNVPIVKSRISNESDISKMWKLAEINEQSQLRSLRLSNDLSAERIVRLLYINSGRSILALAYNGIHKLWEWQQCASNPSGKATTTVPPQLSKPCSEIIMTNDVSVPNLEKAVPSMALSKNGAYVLSASGGKISLFDVLRVKAVTRFMPPPPAATCLAFHPQDNNVVAIGMEDSFIQIYDVREDKLKRKLKGHEETVTGLAFSCYLNVLVSSSADAQVCVWTLEGWEKKLCRFLLRSGRCRGQTRVQFHQDQTQVLVVHETRLTVFEASRLSYVTQWVSRGDPCPVITDATYSCDGQSIFCCFEDGNVFVFSAAVLRLRCRINAAAYLPCSPPSTRVRPLVIRSHPREPNQFALGLSDGAVHVLEPLESQGNRGTSPPQEYGVGSSNTASAPPLDQSSR